MDPNLSKPFASGQSKLQFRSEERPRKNFWPAQNWIKHFVDTKPLDRSAHTELANHRLNEPFASSPGILYQNEVKCSAFDMEIMFHSHANKTFLKWGLNSKVTYFKTCLPSAFTQSSLLEAVLPYKKLMVCAAGWGRIFTTGLTINGVAFLIELLEWGRTFSDFFGVTQFFVFTVSKRIGMFVLQMQSKVFFIQSK